MATVLIPWCPRGQGGIREDQSIPQCWEYLGQAAETRDWGSGEALGSMEGGKDNPDQRTEST